MLSFAGNFGAAEMNEEGTKWFAELRAFVTECRAKRPLIAREELSHAEEIQCRIIGGSLISWLQKYGPHLLQERVMLADLEGWEKDPFVVFTSEQPGLVAAREILEEGPSSIVFLYPKEFTQWLKKHPDQNFRWHVHTWSFFCPLDADSLQKAQKYPLAPGESYWLHREGTMCGPLFGRGGDHLWKWNGREAILLEECLNQWIS